MTAVAGYSGTPLLKKLGVKEGQRVAWLGAPALCVHGGPCLIHGTVAWYEQGALISYEHVGNTSVSWDAEAG